LFGKLRGGLRHQKWSANQTDGQHRESYSIFMRAKLPAASKPLSFVTRNLPGAVSHFR